MQIEEIKNSGILESYVIGDLSNEEIDMVENALDKYPVLKDLVNEIEKALESYAKLNEIVPDNSLKPMMLAMANYENRIESGESPLVTPQLSKESKIVDFQEWLQLPTLQEPQEYESMAGRIISYDDQKMTMVVWLKDGAPPETHSVEHEKFLIVEGSCNIRIGSSIHQLKAGDFIQIPLFVEHEVIVTSSKRCMIILERKAA